MVRGVLRILTTSALVAAPFASASAQQLVTNGVPTEFSGTGLGSVATILTLQSGGNATTEQGCVGRLNATTDFVGPSASGPCVAGPAPDVQPGGVQTNTQLLSALGIDMSSEFGILFNAQEPGNTAMNSITLNSLTANFYSSTGGLVGSVSLASAVNFPSTLTGTGNSGFLFTITPDAAANLFAAGNRVGLSAGLSNATGGPDTFSLVNTGGAPGGGGGGSVVPEPSTYVLLGTGMLGLLGVARRRRRA